MVSYNLEFKISENVQKMLDVFSNHPVYKNLLETNTVKEVVLRLM